MMPLVTVLRIRVSTVLAMGSPLVAMRLDNVYSDNMQSNDNSVNINTDKRRYHHGDLRAALIDAGLALLQQRAVDDVSLREVARAVGVSATAVYRHFPDKQALIHAMCGQGATQLADEQMQAGTAAGGGTAGFEAMGQAYVRFALANPALFRLMMSNQPGGDLINDAPGHVNAAMRQLLESVAALMPPGAREVDRRHAAIHAWSLVHGMAMLMLDGMIPADDVVIASITRGAISSIGGRA
jgi:AcrR family transcriptional regulator